jgi:FKBP12-rapamycin complex-associated protein
MMWLYAPNSETWLRYQMNYSKSMAVMSMVGHILGLGDRHVMNMMLEQTSGRVVHIDFGDCFESAKGRLYFREFVPFRLTRMTVAALGPTGINGMFTTYCEQTMMTVRQNRESILALLEIFAQSPVREAQHMRILARAVSEIQHVAGKFDEILKKIAAKVNGTEFNGKSLPVSQQVALLIQTATDPYNLCQHFHNWYPWW